MLVNSWMSLLFWDTSSLFWAMSLLFWILSSFIVSSFLCRHLAAARRFASRFSSLLLLPVGVPARRVFCNLDRLNSVSCCSGSFLTGVDCVICADWIVCVGCVGCMDSMDCIGCVVCVICVGCVIWNVWCVCNTWCVWCVDCCCGCCCCCCCCDCAAWADCSWFKCSTRNISGLNGLSSMVARSEKWLNGDRKFRMSGVDKTFVGIFLLSFRSKKSLFDAIFIRSFVCVKYLCMGEWLNRWCMFVVFNRSAVAGMTVVVRIVPICDLLSNFILHWISIQCNARDNFDKHRCRSISHKITHFQVGSHLCF